MADKNMVKAISEAASYASISKLKNSKIFIEEVKEDYESIKILSKEILELANNLNVDIPIKYSESITKITISLSKIQTLKSNIINNKTEVERIFNNAYYETLHNWYETQRIKTKQEWKYAFNLAIFESTGMDIKTRIIRWENIISEIEELYQASMEIVQSGKKTLTVMMHNKW